MYITLDGKHMIENLCAQYQKRTHSCVYTWPGYIRIDGWLTLSVTKSQPCALQEERTRGWASCQRFATKGAQMRVFEAKTEELEDVWVIKGAFQSKDRSAVRL
jgi:hypothetical protein